MKTPKPGTTSGFSRNFVFLIKCEFDKRGSFDQNPCSLERNGILFYQEVTVYEGGYLTTVTRGGVDEKNISLSYPPLFFRYRILKKLRSVIFGALRFF